MRRLGIFFAVLYLALLSGQAAYAESFRLQREGGVLVLPVQINRSITLNFTIDSGASDVVIPQDVFSTLSRTGTITSRDMLPSRTYELADGTRHEARRFRIRSIAIGQRELQEITASVAPAGASLLLGQSFLSHLPGWSIDNRRALLIVGDAKESEGSDSPAGDRQAQSDLDKARKWVACSQPFWSKIKAANDYENQLAVLYPRFGLLWTEWTNLASHCSTVMRNTARGDDVSDADTTQCDNETLKRAHADFTNRVAATAEPDAVRDFNMAQTVIRLASAERERTCGNP